MNGATELQRVLADRRAPRVPADGRRMGRERHGRLQAEMARHGVDVALLLHAPHVAYATGRPARGTDVSHAVFERPVAILVAGEDRPHLFGDDVGDIPEDDLDVKRHPAVWPELDEGAQALERALADLVGSLDGHRVALDECTGAMLRSDLLGVTDVTDAAPLVGAAKLAKTADELACIAEAQRRNEAAMLAIEEEGVRPGTPHGELAGAFLGRLPELGVDANLIDPIFQPMPRRVADGPRTPTGAIAFPTGVGNPVLAEGDIVWVDTGIDHNGYASDFGRTWVVGRDPTPSERRLFERWCEVMGGVLDVLRPGATAGDLCRAAEAAYDGPGRPWLPYFYLAHGVGIESAEMPLVGTDLGAAFDDALVLAPGMVLVLEPVVWEDGVGGYRAEEIVAVTEDGWCHLGGGHGYAPFGT